MADVPIDKLFDRPVYWDPPDLPQDIVFQGPDHNLSGKSLKRKREAIEFAAQRYLKTGLAPDILCAQRWSTDKNGQAFGSAGMRKGKMKEQFEDVTTTGPARDSRTGRVGTEQAKGAQTKAENTQRNRPRAAENRTQHAVPTGATTYRAPVYGKNQMDVQSSRAMASIQPRPEQNWLRTKTVAKRVWEEPDRTTSTPTPVHTTARLPTNNTSRRAPIARNNTPAVPTSSRSSSRLMPSTQLPHRQPSQIYYDDDSGFMSSRTDGRTQGERGSSLAEQARTSTPRSRNMAMPPQGSNNAGRGPQNRYQPGLRNLPSSRDQSEPQHSLAGDTTIGEPYTSIAKNLTSAKRRMPFADSSMLDSTELFPDGQPFNLYSTMQSGNGEDSMLHSKMSPGNRRPDPWGPSMPRTYRRSSASESRTNFMPDQNKPLVSSNTESISLETSPRILPAFRTVERESLDDETSFGFQEAGRLALLGAETPMSAQVGSFSQYQLPSFSQYQLPSLNLDPLQSQRSTGGNSWFNSHNNGSQLASNLPAPSLPAPHSRKSLPGQSRSSPAAPMTASRLTEPTAQASSPPVPSMAHAVRPGHERLRKSMTFSDDDSPGFQGPRQQRRREQRKLKSSKESRTAQSMAVNHTDGEQIRSSAKHQKGSQTIEHNVSNGNGLAAGVLPAAQAIVKSNVRPTANSPLNLSSNPLFSPLLNTAQSIAGPIVKPLAKVSAEPVVEPAVKPAVKPIAEPVVKPVIYTVVEPVPETIVQSAVQPLSELIAQPIVQPTLEPIADPVAEPIVERVVESVAEAVVEPVSETIVQSAIQPVSEPIPQSEGQPIAEDWKSAETSHHVQESYNSTQTVQALTSHNSQVVADKRDTTEMSQSQPVSNGSRSVEKPTAVEDNHSSAEMVQPINPSSSPTESETIANDDSKTEEIEAIGDDSHSLEKVEVFVGGDDRAETGPSVVVGESNNVFAADPTLDKDDGAEMSQHVGGGSHSAEMTQTIANNRSTETVQFVHNPNSAAGTQTVGSQDDRAHSSQRSAGNRTVETNRKTDGSEGDGAHSSHPSVDNRIDPTNRNATPKAPSQHEIAAVEDLVVSSDDDEEDIPRFRAPIANLRDSFLSPAPRKRDTRRKPWKARPTSASPVKSRPLTPEQLMEKVDQQLRSQSPWMTEEPALPAKLLAEVNGLAQSQSPWAKTVEVVLPPAHPLPLTQTPLRSYKRDSLDLPSSSRLPSPFQTGWAETPFDKAQGKFGSTTTPGAIAEECASSHDNNTRSPTDSENHQREDPHLSQDPNYEPSETSPTTIPERLRPFNSFMTPSPPPPLLFNNSQEIMAGILETADLISRNPWKNHGNTSIQKSLPLPSKKKRVSFAPDSELEDSETRSSKRRRFQSPPPHQPSDDDTMDIDGVDDRAAREQRAAALKGASAAVGSGSSSWTPRFDDGDEDMGGLGDDILDDLGGYLKSWDVDEEVRKVGGRN